MHIAAIVDLGVFRFGFKCGMYDRLLECAPEARDDIIESLTNSYLAELRFNRKKVA